MEKLSRVIPADSFFVPEERIGPGRHHGKTSVAWGHCPGIPVARHNGLPKRHMAGYPLIVALGRSGPECLVHCSRVRPRRYNIDESTLEYHTGEDRNARNDRKRSLESRFIGSDPVGNCYAEGDLTEQCSRREDTTEIEIPG